MRAEQLMTRSVRTCSADATLEDAARILWEMDLGCLVVVDDEQRPVGMLTDRDIAMAAYTQGLTLRELSVQATMSKNVHCCARSALLPEVEHIMQVQQVRRLPVLGEDGRLIGLITLGDLAQNAAAHPLRLPFAMPGVATTLAVVTERRVAPNQAQAAE